MIANEYQEYLDTQTDLNYRGFDLVAADKICSNGLKCAEHDLGQDLVGGIKDCDGSNIRTIQPVALFVDWVNDTQLPLLR